MGDRVVDQIQQQMLQTEEAVEQQPAIHDAYTLHSHDQIYYTSNQELEELVEQGQQVEAMDLPDHQEV